MQELTAVTAFLVPTVVATSALRSVASSEQLE
jgi:hypothetical protein